MAETLAAKQPDLRLTALRRFAIAITLFNVIGHSYLGFEQSLAQPLASLATAYSLELLLEWVHARANGLKPRFLGGPVAFVNFMLSAHISGLAVAMLLYANDRLLPICFAAAVAIGSKYLFRRRCRAAARGTTSTPRTSASRPRCSPSPGWASPRPTCSRRTSTPAAIG